MREKILRILIDAGKPVGCRHRFHAFDGTDLVTVVQRQRHDQRNGVARNETVRRGAFRSGIPRIHHGLQQAEGENGDDQPQHGETGAQLVPQRVAEDELDEVHQKP